MDYRDVPPERSQVLGREIAIPTDVFLVAIVVGHSPVHVERGHSLLRREGT